MFHSVSRAQTDAIVDVFILRHSAKEQREQVRQHSIVGNADRRGPVRPTRKSVAAMARAF